MTFIISLQRRYNSAFYSFCFHICFYQAKGAEETGAVWCSAFLDRKKRKKKCRFRISAE